MARLSTNQYKYLLKENRKDGAVLGVGAQVLAAGVQGPLSGETRGCPVPDTVSSSRPCLHEKVFKQGQKRLEGKRRREQKE